MRHTYFAKQLHKRKLVWRCKERIVTNLDAMIIGCFWVNIRLTICHNVLFLFIDNRKIYASRLAPGKLSTFKSVFYILNVLFSNFHFNFVTLELEHLLKIVRKATLLPWPTEIWQLQKNLTIPARHVATKVTTIQWVEVRDGYVIYSR